MNGFHLFAFYESIANGSAYAEVNGVQDQSMTLDASSRLQAPGDWQVLALAAIGANLSAAQLNAPSLRNTLLPEIYPNTVGAEWPDNRGPEVYDGRGPVFKNGEFITAAVSRGGADAQPAAVFMWFAPAVPTPPAGRVYTLPYTFTIVLTAGTWAFGTLTPAQILPAGKYAVIGMACVCADALAARLVFPGRNEFRPGVLVQETYGNVPWGDRFRMGRFGQFGDFLWNTQPNVEVIGHTAGSESGTVYLDLVKIG